MSLLAHHLEAHHVPILASFFAAGFFIGWQALSRWLRRARLVPGEPPGGEPPGSSRRSSEERRG